MPLYHYRIHETAPIEGPVSGRKLREEFAKGKLPSQTQIREASSREWQSISELINKPVSKPQVKVTQVESGDGSGVGVVISCFLLALLTVGAVFAPIGMYIESSELSGRFRLPEWTAKLAGVGLFGAVVFFTKVYAAYFDRRSQSRQR